MADYAQTWTPDEKVDDFLRHTIGEVLLVLLFTEIAEGQHRNRFVIECYSR